MPTDAVLQPGTEQLAAGYVIYGSSTMLVYTTGHGVHGFTLDPAVGAYVLSHENIRMPAAGNIYSSNEANCDTFPPAYQDYLHASAQRRDRPQLLAPLHRLAGRRLPPHAAQGRRLPLSADQVPPQRQAAAALRSQPHRLHRRASRRHRTDGQQRILDIEPTTIHQRTPLVVGSRAELELFQRFARFHR